MTRFLALILALLAALASLPAAAQNFPPRPDGPVLDQADILPPAEEAALDAKLRAYNQQTGRSVVVATVNSLNGEDPQFYTRNLARAWGIGGEESRQGVLMMVAPNDRKVFISTARGVQTTLTDISTARIVRNVIIPAFKNDDMAGGVIAGVDAVLERLNMDPAEAQALAEAEAAAAKNGRSDDVSIGGVIFWIVLIVFLVFLFGRGGARGRRHGAGGVVGDVILWGALNALSNSDGDGWGGGGGSSGGGGFGGFGGGGGGFNGGGSGGSW
ncbi:TPM domain-containing protein [Altererythrobacter xixiisoli]|uniref:TPM domain-containing protein n=1 Tax=Croceibacterium xixiisoli TaxID=1476466 RepID=A0A6I4TR53_9SPHN|nr:TPM domain-containing protein [Croceibacterium xixiisoli]MXO98382.1 TPM domain-containing protein [Croceibacterium xixiisoli]